MAKSNERNGFYKGVRVKLISDFKNGQQKVVARAGQEGVVVGRQPGSGVVEIRIDGLEHTIFPLRSDFILA